MKEFLKPIRLAIANTIARAIVRLVDDGTLFQSIQIEVRKKEVRSGVERFQDYGFTSVPHPGAEAVVLFPGGLREQGLVIVIGDRRFRLKDLQSGEVGMYTDEGDSIVLKRDRKIAVTCGDEVTVTAPTVHFTGDVIIDGEATIGGIAFSTHKHGGVQTGAGSTGNPHA